MTPRLASDALASTGADMIAVYNGVSPYIIDATDLANITMQPGCGYWVHVANDTSWDVASADVGDDELCSEPPAPEPAMALPAATPSATIETRSKE
jgi:Tfp pilus assembly protein FimV